MECVLYSERMGYGEVCSVLIPISRVLKCVLFSMRLILNYNMCVISYECGCERIVLVGEAVCWNASVL